MSGKLLFLCQTLPYPPDGGVHIRTYNIMRLLSRAFDVTALCFYREATRPTPARVRAGKEGLEDIADVEVFPIPQEGHRARFIRDHLRSIATRRVYTRYVYESAEFRAALEGLLTREQFDLVHVDSLDLSAYLPLLSGLPVVCTHHNVESDLLRRRAATEPQPLRGYLKHQARLMAAEERRWCGDVALNAVVSGEDAARLTAIAPDAAVTVVPNGVDTSAFRPGGDGDHRIVFVGGHGWYPNRDGMAYFAERILPLLRRDDPSLQVTWVGRAPDDVRERYRREHAIDMTGYVDDIRPYVERAAVYVVPLRVGGGTRLKILDAWAMGKAVVSTSIGCEGLDARDGDNILIRDTPEAFAGATRAVLEEQPLRNRIGRGGRRTVETVYDWDIIGQSMIEEYRTLAEGSRSPAT